MYADKSVRSRFVYLIIAACLGWGFLHADLRAQTVTFSEYPLPNAGSNPSRVVPDLTELSGLPNSSAIRSDV